VNPKKFTLRGLHYQTGETSQAKLVKVINGRILDFVVDLRVPLRSYNNCQFFEMKGGDELIVPRGFAHGFITLEENTVVQYLVDNDYSQKTEGSLFWSSFPEIKNEILRIDSTFDEFSIIISEKDLVVKS
jgi:dTDP-4-dehydrorhamnose 3,5-epimerase